MRGIEQLIEESRDPRLDRLPLYARQLIRDLARRLDTEYRRADSIAARAEQEVAEARALLAGGPEGSDTFVDLPRSRFEGHGDDDLQRPLGTGVPVEFREPDEMPGEGITVTRQDGVLHLNGCNLLAVIPVNLSYVKIERR